MSGELGGDFDVGQPMLRLPNILETLYIYFVYHCTSAGTVPSNDQLTKKGHQEFLLEKYK